MSTIRGRSASEPSAVSPGRRRWARAQNLPAAFASPRRRRPPPGPLVAGVAGGANGVGDGSGDVLGRATATSTGCSGRLIACVAVAADRAQRAPAPRGGSTFLDEIEHRARPRIRPWYNWGLWTPSRTQVGTDDRHPMPVGRRRFLEERDGRRGGRPLLLYRRSRRIPPWGRCRGSRRDGRSNA